jgi:ATP-dependent Lon protease
MQNILFSGLMDDDADFIPILADGDESELTNVEFPDILPILPLRNTVMFPGVVLPISVGRQKSLQLIQEVYRGNRLIGTVAQKDGSIDDPGQADLYEIGTIAQILKILEMPDGTTSVIIQGKKRFEIQEYTQEFPYLKAKVNPLIDLQPHDDSVEFSAVVGSLKDLSIKIAQYSSQISPEASFAVKNIENSTFLINYICSNADLKVEEKQVMLGISELKERGIQAIT